MVSSTRMQMDAEHVSVSVRKIQNGFVVSKSTSGPKGYKSEDMYHERKPSIDIQSIPCVDTGCDKSTKVNANALRKASGNKKVKNT